MERLRFGVIGTGRLGGFHAQKLAANEAVELIGVVDPCREARTAAAEKCQTAALADHQALFDQVDAVVIASPTTHHHAIGLDFLQRGVHVLMEKPLASTAAEANDLVRAAEAFQCVLTVGHVERFNPALATAAKHLAEPMYIDAVRASGFTFRSTDIGVVLDLMIHDIDVVLALVDSPVKSVEAIGLSLLGGHEDVANARITFESGCRATLSASRVSHSPARRMDVWARGAFATIDFGARKTQVVEMSDAVRTGQFRVQDLSAEQVEHYKQHLHDEHLPLMEFEDEAVDALVLEQADFIEAIQTGREPTVSGEDGRDAVVLAHRVLECIAEGAEFQTPMQPSVVPAPHFHIAAPTDGEGPHRKAG